MNTIKYICVILIFLICNQCKNKPVNNTWNTNTADTTLNAATNFLLPSPDEIFADLEMSEIVVNEKFANNLLNANNYIDIKSKSLNLGIYIADFAYLSLNNNKFNSISYLKAIQEMAEELNIYEFLSENIMDRIQQNLTNNDSIMEISREAYFGITEALETSGQKNILALISAGALIETLYLASMSVGAYTDYKLVIRNIFEQKYLLNNIISFLNQYNNDNEIKKIATYLKNLKNEFGESIIKAKTYTKDKANHINVKGGETPSINEGMFKNLKQKISETRNTIIKLKK